ncbi:hypothetical protein [Clostridium estertheticum]|uniref:Uncharacterized protein n=1 Tax=Clostridium estertheticum TaxID=238834 RepID=A0A7Y3WTE7_9CLOT|nr:hypothetical protein [Clostridium estertheticum]MBW9171762.1 hypothetical protein [Clostridium estertheticum]NNU77071.1 hypothetical protein [Clostridium estertheticum]WBL47841.1 hypothetical protein LOR37_04015 [Clostridium estertheticum]WLC75934.1 hypothetical protein KTC99_03650 [Clostridium estertheticum]
MKAFDVVYEVARADFLQRIRQKSTLIAIVFMMYFSYLAVPDLKATYYNTVLGVSNEVGYRGIYNSAWIGFLITLIIVTYMTLIGFFLTKNTISRDRQTKIGQIVATSSIDNKHYLFGKVLSNFLYLVIMIIVIMIVAIFLQIIRAESTQIELWKIIAPFLFMAIPAMFITSILSVVFESTPSLQKTGGNIVYFFLWIMIMTLSVLGNIGTLIPNALVRNVFEQISGHIDIFGLGKLSSAMLNGILQGFPDFKGGITIGAGVGITKINTFKWNGMQWTIDVIMYRIIWILIAIVLFRYVASKFKKENLIDKEFNVKKPIRTNKAKKKIKNDDFEGHVESNYKKTVLLTPNNVKAIRFNFVNMVIEELNLMLKGVSPWWFVFQAVLILNSVSVPNNVAMSSIIPVTFIFPLLIWSKAGTLDKKYGTEQYLFSSTYYKIEQFIALWVSVAFFTAIISVGAIAKILISGGIVNVLALLVGIAFISSLAVFLGTVSGNSILFELIYIALWYMGPLNKLPYFDYLGFSHESILMGMPMVYSIISVVLIGAALLFRIIKVNSKYN